MFDNLGFELTLRTKLILILLALIVFLLGTAVLLMLPQISVKPLTTYICNDGREVYNPLECSAEKQYSSQDLNLAVESAGKEVADFSKDYAEASMDLQTSYFFSVSANALQEDGEFYLFSDDVFDYEYSALYQFFSVSNSGISDAKGLATLAFNKFESLKGKEPNEFFEEDVALQSKRALLIKELLGIQDGLGEVLIDTLDYLFYSEYDEVYAQQLLDEYGALAELYNAKIEEINIIEERIDAHWEKDWFKS